jgi:ketosteroid isomerase-like protein
MRNSLLILSVLMQMIVYGQTFTPKQQEVINAENSFAGLSKSANTVEAFMAYLSDSTIMFDKDNKPVYGMSLYKDRKPNNSLLFWWPVFIGASADGQMGFSSGPWEFSLKRDSLPVAYGYYATLWQKDAKGHWKMKVDLGIQFPESEKSNPPLKASPIDFPTSSLALSDQRLMDADKSYNELLKTSSYIKERFSTDGHLLRSDHKPFVDPREFGGLDEKGKRFSYSQVGGGVADVHDMFYSYGTVKTTAADGKTSDEKYFRVWKIEKNNWKIVLDVLSN